jgi:hypothetical protein
MLYTTNLLIFSVSGKRNLPPVAFSRLALSGSLGCIENAFAAHQG